MRLIKLFGLAALAAVAAMAFVGASTAMAKEDTALCKVHQEPCAEANLWKHLHFELTANKPAELLNSTANVLCLKSLVLAHVESPYLAEAPNPLGIKVLELTWEGCGTNAAHNNCVVTNEGELPLFDLLREALNTGLITVLDLKVGSTFAVRVKCTIFGFIKIDCTYKGSGVHLEAFGAGGTNGKGMVSALGVEVAKLGGGDLCPEEAFWDALYEPLENVYITT